MQLQITSKGNGLESFAGSAIKGFWEITLDLEDACGGWRIMGLHERNTDRGACSLCKKNPSGDIQASFCVLVCRGYNE